MMRSRFAFFVLALASVTGCGGSAETVAPDPYALSERRLASAYERLTAPAPDSAAAASRARFAVRRMTEYGLMPAFASGFTAPLGRHSEVSKSPAHVLGYVAGRNPSQADTLVLVAAALDMPEAAAVLETARRLALEALDAQVPERTVLFALWAPPRTGPVGLSDYLARPTWGLAGLAHVLIVGADASSAQETLALVDAAGLEGSVLLYEPMPETAGRRPAQERLQALTAFAETLHAHVRGLSIAPTSSSVGTSR